MEKNYVLIKIKLYGKYEVVINKTGISIFLLTLEDNFTYIIFNKKMSTQSDIF